MLPVHEAPCKQEKKNRSGEIPTDSFSDIAFLLIIYFLVATTLVKVKSITADLPAGEKSTQAQSDKTPIINLRGAEVFFNDKRMECGGSTQRLAALDLPNLDGEKRVIMLESAKGTPYENYFQALAAISANGGVVAIVEEE
jgi:biopolymer transport protein ExbD